MKFSVALIAKNEEKTLPRLLESLKGIEDIVLVDTGSTDKTIEVAKSFGVKVFEQRFDIVITEEMKEKIDILIGDNEIKVGDTAFNFAEARNWISQRAKNDMIFMPDCDEIVEWKLDEVEKLLDKGIDRLAYKFTFSFDSEGRPLIEFTHSKFYNRNKLYWVRNIHEVLASKDGKPCNEKWTDLIYLKHYQNPETNRGQYLKGLAIDYIQNPYNDRNCHYFARELYYKEKWNEAIERFKEHIEKPGWITEQGQSYVYMGLCYKALGDRRKAKECFLLSIGLEPNRREPYMELALMYYEDKLWKEAERIYRLVLDIPDKGYYSNYKPNYTHLPWGQMSVCLFNQGRKMESLSALKEALRLDPNNETYKNNLKYY